MSFRKMTLAAILTSASALAVHAQDVGGGAQAGGGVGAVGGLGENAGTGTGANAGFGNADAGVGDSGADRDTSDAGANVGADAGAEAAASDAMNSASGVAAQALNGLNEGTSIMSADGQVIGEIAGTRTADDGRTQALISVSESANLAANRIAVDVRSLEQDATGAVEYAMNLADLRASVNASVNAKADAGMND